MLVGGTLFCVVHAKEPKSEEAARVLVAYMQALVAESLLSASKMLTDIECNSWCILSDTNLGKEKLAVAFARRLTNCRTCDN